ncbi:MAG TPA: VOC family protein [Tepidiformaceae bacterium]|nr:VOC family protein [Tepidiformaceae bacterium]
MPNHVVSFELRGSDLDVLKQFYADVFGWDVFVWGPDYVGLDTAVHTHDDATGSTTYTGEDAYMNEGVQISEENGHHGWRFKGESQYREFAPGVSGGIARGSAGVTFYIQASDLDASLARVEAHGGKAVRRPEEVAPNVVIAAFADPAGNEIGLIRARQE